MDAAFDLLTSELERFGMAHDAVTPDSRSRMLNITRDTGEFLSVLVRATGARRVLEIGTSNGYSTLWLAQAAEAIGGTVTTVELSEHKIALAAANFARSGLGRFITQVHGDAAGVLRRGDPGAYDLIFLDSERSAYPAWWHDLRRALHGGGLLVVDNATSHPLELAPFVALLKADPEWATCIVPVGKGELLAAAAGHRHR